MEIQVGRLPQRGEDDAACGNPEEYEVSDAIGSQHYPEISSGECTDPMLVNHDLIGRRCDRGVKRCQDFVPMTNFPDCRTIPKTG